MRRPVLVLVTALALSLTVRPAAAWSPAGHMVLGAVTYFELQRIDPAALEAVLELLAAHPHHGELLDGPDDRALDPETRRIALFMRAARWADDVRRPPYDEYSESTWHYVNFRYRPPDELSPPRGPQQDGYLLWALEENVRRLGSDSDAVRAVALTWLFHLVTDVHQPMHDIALVDAAHPDGDRGGNLSFVRVSPEAKTYTLHWVWDGLIIESDAVPEALARARQLWSDRDLVIEDRDELLAVEDFRAWAEEGARIAIDRGYLGGRLRTGTAEDGVVLPPGYLDAARATAERRGVLSALRLAHLLAARF